MKKLHLIFMSFCKINSIIFLLLTTCHKHIKSFKAGEVMTKLKWVENVGAFLVEFSFAEE